MADVEQATPWAALDRAARVAHTPCGDGQMVWRMWGEGTPLVLLHGGAGSWLHWLRVIPALSAERLVVVPDLPGLGGSADPPPSGADGDSSAAAVAAGLDAVLGRDVLPDVVGFSYGSAVAGLAAVRRPVRSVTVVGAVGLGIIRGSNPLQKVRGKEGAERDAAHRSNLLSWMIADPARIDDDAVAIQDWNTRHSRHDSRPLARSQALAEALRTLRCPIAGIWGARDQAMQGETDRARDALRAIRPDVPFEVVPNAGHWCAFEAPDAFLAALHAVLPPAPLLHVQERPA